MSPLYTVFRTHDIDNLYLEFYFKTMKWHRFMKLNGDSGARFDRFTISSTQFMEMPIPYPTLEEQQKIGEYFDSLDHFITLHQRKCEETKKLKKYMLQKMFPKNGQKIPEIRFSGFTEDWEQRKFGEIVEKYEDPIETPTEGYTRLGIRSHAKGTFHSYVEKGKELETAKMFRVAADKFIVNITFGWEHAVAITDENDAGKLVSHRFPQYSFNAGMNPKFFRYLILDEDFKHHLELSSPGGAGRNRVLKLNDMLQYKMNFPYEAEQKKIAAYFDDLDHLITLHHRKYAKKQKDVINDWEQRKLGEVAQYRRGSFPQPYGKSEWYDGENAMPFVQVADVTDNMKLVSDTKQKISEHAQPMSVFAEKGSVLVTLQGSIGRVAITQYGAFVDRTVLIFEDYKTEIDNAFWAYIVKQKFIEEAKKAPGGTIKTITKEVLSDFDMMLPSYDEQVRLGVYFQSLDHLITLHQHKQKYLKKH